jgi:TPR repeat protein
MACSLTVFLDAALVGGALAQTPAAPAASAPAAVDTTVSDVNVTARRNRRAGGPDGPVTANGLLAPPAEAPKSRSCEADILSNPSALDLVMQAIEDPGLMPPIYLPTRLPRNPDYNATAVPPDGQPVKEAAPFWTPRPINFANPTPRDIAAMVCRVRRVPGAALVPGEPLPMDLNPKAIPPPPGVYMAMGRSEIAGADTTLPTALALFDEGRYQQSLEYFEKAYAKLTSEEGGDEAELFIGKLNLFAPIAGADRVKGLAMLERTASARFNPALDMPTFDPEEPERNTAIGEAAMILGQFYLKGGAGVQKDPAKALKWFERANDVGHVAAAKIAGDMYFSGVGAPRDLKKAAALYREAAKLDYAPAQFAYGQMLDRGDLGKPDVKQALAWYDHAAKYEHPGALYALGAAYEAGDGVVADPARALTYYQRAALKGSAPAARAMANHLYRGEGVTKDLAAARKLFESAALQGDAEAMYSLGAMMMRGEGGPVDNTKAWVWLKLADAGKVAGAPVALAVLERRMTAAERKAAEEIYAPKAG